MNAALAGYRGTTVAVTGARGYIGAALLARLRESGARVVAASRRRFASDDGVDWLQLDPQSPESWTPIVSRAEVVFHLAGNTSVYDAERDPDASLAATVLPVSAIAASAALAGRRPRVVFASTATVYGLTPQLPVDETRVPDPITTYDCHKLQAERLLIEAAAHLDGVALRLSNVYGPSAAPSGAPERGFLNRSIERALSGLDIEIYGDGGYVRDFVHLDDVVRALLLAGCTAVPDHRCVNIGSGAGVTIRDAVSIAVAHAARVSGRAVVVRGTPWPDHAHPIERRNFVANIDRARASLHWTPAIGLDEGLRAFANQSATSGCAR